MMKRSLLVIGFVLFVVPAYSWDLSGNAGSRGSSMGCCSVAMCDFWSIQNNPAGMACWRDFSLGLSYENRFLMKELSYYNCATVLPLNIGTFGLSFSRFGYSQYNENKLGLAYARAFGPHLRLGVQIDYLAVKFSEDYSTRRNATFELGLQSDITEKLTLGAYVLNPIRTPTVFRFGLAYKITADVLATTEVEYLSEGGIDYRFGVEYLTTKEFYVRVGVHTNPATASVGAGYTMGRVVIDVAASMNQYTGVSFQTSLIFNIKNLEP